MVISVIGFISVSRVIWVNSDVRVTKAIRIIRVIPSTPVIRPSINPFASSLLGLLGILGLFGLYGLLGLWGLLGLLQLGFNKVIRFIRVIRVIIVVRV